MKGIVVEINKKDAVILSEEGLFTKIRNENYQAGQTVTIKKATKRASKPAAGAAAAAAAFAVCTLGALAYYTPTDYVSLDVNPSVEYSVNMFERTLEVKAVNDYGEEILSNLNLTNMVIEDAVKATLDRLIDGGYITDDPDGKVVITTSNDKSSEAEQLAADLEREVRNYLERREDIAAEVSAEAVRPERVREARELGVTPGKLILVETLQESTGGAINMEEWLTKPVKAINEAIKENRRQDRDKDSDENIKKSEQEEAMVRVPNENGKPSGRPGKSEPDDGDMEENRQPGRFDEEDRKQDRDQNNTDYDNERETKPGGRPPDKGRADRGSGNSEEKKQ